MPVFEYTAFNEKGKSISGIIDADSSSAARNKLRASNIFTITIKEVHESSELKKTHHLSFDNPFGRVKPSEVSIMTRQLATLVGAGLPLVNAIDSLIPQTRSKIFKKNLAKIKDSIVEGNSFASALSLFPAAFSDLYINMVSAGESSGTLEIVLGRLADVTEKQQRLKRKVTSALAYPLIMLIIGTIVLVFLITFIVPSVTTIFTNMKQVLPTPTLFLIAISDFFKSYWWLTIMFGIMMGAGYYSMGKTKKGRSFIDKLKLRIPIVGPLAKKITVARFSRTLGSLLENGVSMLVALDIVQNIAGNMTISKIIEEASKDVSKGQPLAYALGKADVFPALSIQMIQVGEQSGKLENMLDKVAEVFENEVESSIMGITSLLEPIMIIIMGVIVGFIVLSICLPIFEMNQLIH